MNLNDIQKPKSVFTAILFSSLAWLLLRILRTPKADVIEDNTLKP